MAWPSAWAPCKASGYRSIAGGFVTSLSRLGDSLSGVRQPSFGLAATLSQEKASALEAAGQSDSNRIAFEQIASNLRARSACMNEATRRRIDRGHGAVSTML
jgi:hypothetical protein